MKISKEIEKIEVLEKEIEKGIISLEKASSFNTALIYGLFLGLLSNIGATIIYEIFMRELPDHIQTVILVTVLIAIPLLIVLLFRELNKFKKSGKDLNERLEILRSRKNP